MHSIHQEEAQQPEDAHVRASSDIRAPASTPPMGEATLRNEAARLVISGPASGQRLHAFTLPDSTGQPIQLWQYLQRSNVLLFFHHGVNCAACEACLQELAAQLDAYRQEETAVVAIGPDEPAENRHLAARLGHPFPFLSDPAGRVIAQQELATPSLIIADRWGEIWAAWLGGTNHQIPSEQDILQWLSFIEAQCPECTMIEWTDQEDDHLPA
jgi:peroxiredoxin